MADSPATRTRKPSARSLIAVTGAAAMAVTLAHATATQATPSSTVSSKAQVATGNYYPTPLTPEVRCRTHVPGTNWGPISRRAEVSWDPVPGATGYILELIEYNGGNPGGELKQSYERAPGDSLVVGGIVDSGRDVLYARVRTVNGPEVSSGYTTPVQRISFKDHASSRTECENTSRPSQPNQPWENTHEWDPNTAAPAGNRAGIIELRSARVSDSDESVEETDESADTTSATSTSATSTSEVTTDRTTSPGMSTSSPSTSSPTTSPDISTTSGKPTPPTTTETPRKVKPQLTRTTAAPSGAVTAGMTADGRVALVDGDGIQLVDGEVGSSVELQWQNGVDILWIIGPDQIHRIMKSVDGTWKFYLDSGQNLPAGIG